MKQRNLILGLFLVFSACLFAAVGPFQFNSESVQTTSTPVLSAAAVAAMQADSENYQDVVEVVVE